jgi:hypothetical protein
MRKILLAAAVIVVIAAVALWWDAGHGQGWMAVQTGTRCGPTGEPYCYWSGFGSVWPWNLIAMGGIFTGVGLIWRAHTCHYAWWCWRRPHHQVADTAHFICGHHHPEITPTTAREAVAAMREGAQV